MSSHRFYPEHFENAKNGRQFWILLSFHNAQKALRAEHFASYRFWMLWVYRALLNYPRKGGWWHHPRDSKYRLWA